MLICDIVKNTFEYNNTFRLRADVLKPILECVLVNCVE